MKPLSASTSGVETVVSFTFFTRHLGEILARGMPYTVEILNLSGKVMVLLHGTN
ncbi:MAG TPA: hypothetical protein V6D30_03460 [Leptolyngbyaceae cyanobacterium]